MIGDLDGYSTLVWYHPNGIANILSMYRAMKHCRVQYDSEETAPSFHVTKPDGSVRDFKPSAGGLHYCDTRETENETALVNTVAAKKSKYTIRAYRQAQLARRIHA